MTHSDTIVQGVMLSLIHILRSLLLHDDEVGQTWRLNGTTGARAHDSRNLWDDTRSEDVALENLTVKMCIRDRFI